MPDLGAIGRGDAGTRAGGATAPGVPMTPGAQDAVRVEAGIIRIISVPSGNVESDVIGARQIVSEVE